MRREQRPGWWLAPLVAATLGLAAASPAAAQQPDSVPVTPRDTIYLPADQLMFSDSASVERYERARTPPKVLHAEPLFIDLIRDLGARKGEAEWNVGFGAIDRGDFQKYTGFIEYEWAPIDRLGLEIELPFFVGTAPAGAPPGTAPPATIESLKLAMQRTVVVDTARNASVALGYIHEFLLPPVRSLGASPLLAGHLFNPFLVAAKRFGDQEHVLWYGGLRFERLSGAGWEPLRWESNLNLHHMITGTRNFVGLEVNKTLQAGAFTAVLRPQMRLSLRDDLLLGVVTSIPVERERERLGFFLRFIYEPGHTRNPPGPLVHGGGRAPRRH